MLEQANREIDFTIFLIYRLSESWGKLPADVYKILESAGALSNYVLPFYDTLHTLGSEYLVDDLTEYVQSRGVAI